MKDLNYQETYFAPYNIIIPKPLEAQDLDMGVFNDLADSTKANPYLPMNQEEAVNYKGGFGFDSMNGSKKSSGLISPIGEKYGQGVRMISLGDGVAFQNNQNSTGLGDDDKETPWDF